MKSTRVANEKTGLLYHQKHMSIAEEEEEDDEDSITPIKPHRRIFAMDVPKPYILSVGCIFASLILVFVVKSLEVPERHHHDHTLPSFLGIRCWNVGVDGMSNDAPKYSYVNVMDNEVYRVMQNESSTFVMRDHGDVHGLILDKEEIAVHDNITVSWEPTLVQQIYGGDGDGDGDELDSGGDLQTGDNFIVALYCPAGETDPRKFVDAASLSQIEGTMASYGMNMSEDSNAGEDIHVHARHKWYIPSFPVMKEDTCEFRLWGRHMSVEDPNSKSKIMHPEQRLDNKSESIVLRAKSPVMRIKDGSVAPMTIHLAMTTESDEMMVQFSTGVSNVVNNAMVPVVMYGTSSKNMSVISREGNTTSYKATDLCQAPANLEEPGKFTSPHLLHNVKMKGLVADTRYYYKVGLTDWDSSENLDSKNSHSNDVKWSEVYSFRSPIPAGMKPENSAEHDDTEEPFVFIVYADQGITGYGGTGNDDGKRVSKFTEREIQKNGARAVHHFGDLSYAQGASHIWDAWLDMVSVFATQVPLMIGVGNHEYDHTFGGGGGKDPSGLMSDGGYNPEWGNFLEDSQGECGVPVSKRFVMPANGNGVYWYSFDHGFVHTIMISSEHDLSPKSLQYQWLERDLLSIDRTKTPWVIVESHRPMYMIEDVPSNTLVGIHMRRDFESLLYRHNVDLYLAGHYHAYFRTCAGLYKGKCHNGGVTHITVGTAGAELDSTPLLRKNWADFFSAEWGYGRITVFDKTSLLWEFISDQDGEVKDSTWLRKE